MSTTDDRAAPLRSFAECHAGIVTQLREFASLPPLADAARRARSVAAAGVALFRDVILEHHAEEERELFPAVIASARAGDERSEVQRIVARLTLEHRGIEALWKRLRPTVGAIAGGADAALDGAALTALVDRYLEHALYEEDVFLPLAHQILSRNGDHMAALGLSLHLRHAVPQLLRRGGFRI